MKQKLQFFIAVFLAICVLLPPAVYSKNDMLNKAQLSVVDVRTDRNFSWDGWNFQSFPERFLRDFFELKAVRPEIMRCQSEGAGVIFDASGLVLTNEHVVADAEIIEVVLADKRVFRAVVLGRNRKEDLALLKIESDAPLNLVPMALSDSDLLNPGQRVFAVGNPYGYSRSVAGGVISALHRPFKTDGGVPFGDLIQTDASVNPGNSGGPLLNEAGEMIGLITLRDWRAHGINFAIPVNRIKTLLPELKTSENAKLKAVQFQKRFGFQVAEVKDPRGIDQLVIENVLPRSFVQKAGLRAGDVLELFQKKTVRDLEELVVASQKVALGEQVYLKIRRNGQEFFTYIEAK